MTDIDRETEDRTGRLPGDRKIKAKPTATGRCLGTASVLERTARRLLKLGFESRGFAWG